MLKTKIVSSSLILPYNFAGFTRLHSDFRSPRSSLTRNFTTTFLLSEACYCGREPIRYAATMFSVACLYYNFLLNNSVTACWVSTDRVDTRHLLSGQDKICCTLTYSKVARLLLSMSSRCSSSFDIIAFKLTFSCVTASSLSSLDFILAMKESLSESVSPSNSPSACETSASIP